MEKGDVVDVEKVYVVVEPGNVDGGSNGESSAKIEIVIDVHAEDVEVVWSVVEIVNDVNVGRKLADVVDP